MVLEESITLKEWLEKQLLETEKLGSPGELLGGKDGFSEILLKLKEFDLNNDFEKRLQETLESYQWQIHNQLLLETPYVYGKKRAYLATIDFVQKINHQDTTPSSKN
ncbi:hypothetical protein CIRMBP1315_02245 [Enterococcus cecorum]|uniref:hypothetical protein n=1 Tax=Enterococcus cecorum TaxID=44008 RepID=UPI0006429598|nr:hypothetical protein [Enterococcus cecorum]KLO68353.1 hypothetical protein AA986_01030 [Enterococcus cecorum]CAI3510214.1 hypothetical protein CIRMBP1315_02245 [Enterococcus cecorum]